MWIMLGGTSYEYEVDQVGCACPCFSSCLASWEPLWPPGAARTMRRRRRRQRIPSSWRRVSGDDQVGETGRELPDPIVVRVHDAEGIGVEGVTVAFEVTGGGGSLSASSDVTDPDGLASVSWTMGVPPVWNRVRASAGGDEVEFVAWADPGERPAAESYVFEGGGLDFANEDLAFEEGRGLFLGSPGAILNIPAPGSSRGRDRA